MIKTDQIPDAIARIADEAYYDTAGDNPTMSDEDIMKHAIAAALNAWPWKFTADSIKMEHIVLPLPEAPEGRIAERMEPSDD